MFPLRRWHMLLLSLALLATPAWAARSHRSPTAHRHHYSHHHYVRRHRRAVRHASMAPDRVRQIQAALIEKHYLTGTPNGDWNAQTQAAMRSYQADHGWQTKLMPDARALIALGLGPKVDEAHLQNTLKQQQPQPSISYADTLAAVQIVPK